MAQKDDWPPPATILAFGAAVTAALVAFGYAVRLILPAIGTAVGLVVATATTGLATAGFVADWVAPAAGAGVGAAGAALTLRLLITIQETAREKPYEWTLPLLGVASGLALNLWKDLTDAPKAARLALGGIAALWIVIAGACYKHRGWLWKCAAVLLYILPPVVLLALDMRRNSSTPTLVYFTSVSTAGWLVVLAFILVGILVAILEHLMSRPD